LESAGTGFANTVAQVLTSEDCDLSSDVVNNIVLSQYVFGQNLYV
jgi:hypothetical protein